MAVSVFMVFVFPLLITTILLAGHARWAWGRTVDKLLHGMELEAVKKRVEDAQKHRTYAKRHATGVGTLLLFGVILSILMPYSNWASFPGWMLLWAYVILIPHLLALYLYHLRWNPRTLERKRKLDAEDVVYEGDFSLKDDVQYGIDEEGELIEIAAAEASQRLQEQP